MSTNTTNKRETGVLSTVLFRYLPYWPVFILGVIICVTLAWRYTASLTPVYQATATIMINDESNGSPEEKVLETMKTEPAKVSVENEIEVLHSRSLMKEVIERLCLYAPVFEEKSFTAAYTSSPIIVKAKDPSNIIEQYKIPFVYDVAKNQVGINQSWFQMNRWQQTPYGVLMFTKNPYQKRSTGEALAFQLMNPGRIANIYLANLTIAPINKSSSVVMLKLQEAVPERGEHVLNTLAEVYGRAAMVNKNARASNTLSFLDDRIKYVEDDLDSLERRIQHYKSGRGIVDLSAQGRMFLENLGSNDQKLADMNIQLAVLDQVEKYVVSKDDRSGIVPSTMGLGDGMLSGLLDKLYNAETQYEKLRKTTAENNPVLLSIKSEIDRMRPSILENIRSQRAGMRASMHKVDAATDVYSSMLRSIPKEEKELLDYTRQQSIKNSVYTFLLQKREEAALSQSATVSDSRIVDTAESALIPNQSKKSVIYLLAIFLGIGLPAACISLKDMFNSKVLYRTELDQLSTVPVVAEITKTKSKEALLVHKPEYIICAEQFRQLRAAIGLYGKTSGRRKILVTSSISGEGKSFVSANLAISLAQAGKKVALVDMDLRNPRVSELFGFAEEKGLGEYLQGKASLEEITKSSSFPSLYVVPAGVDADNPTELLLNGSLSSFFEIIEKDFDYTIVDTSPVDPVTDAYVLSDYCDTTLYVVRHGYTPKTMIQLLDESNKIKALKNLAIVFNGVKPRGFISKGFGFGYGYGYENVYEDRVYRRVSKVSKDA